MATRSQRYWIRISSRARKDESVEKKHTKFFAGLKDLPEPWGLGSRPIPPVPEFDEYTLAVCEVARCVRASEANIIYAYRHDFKDNSSWDDRIVVMFRPAKVDLKYLIYTALPTYITAFDAYHTDWFDDVIHEGDHDGPRLTGMIDRYMVSRVGPVSYFDDLLCRRAFGMRAKDVVHAFRGHIEHAEEIHGGAYLVGSSQVLSFEESEKLATEMQRHLLVQRRGVKWGDVDID